MWNLLKLSDGALARSLYDLEKYRTEQNADFEAFRQARSHLSRVAWDAYAGALGCDGGPLAATGVHSAPMDGVAAQQFNAVLEKSPAAALLREDFALGHMATLEPHILNLLNGTNDYREATPEFVDLLRGYLGQIGPEVERVLGHPWRVASIRQFYLRPKASAGRHLDGWPVSMRKLFILPSGATRQSGTTWFRLRNGREIMLESERPIWAIFENSVVDHALVSSEIARPTIEVDFVPASKTSTEPFYAGMNGWYPWFPSEQGFLDATRVALSFALAGGSGRESTSWSSQLWKTFRRR